VGSAAYQACHEAAGQGRISLMRYEVRYLAGGEEQTEVVDAPDAPAAVSLIQYEHGREDSTFELLSVTLLDAPENHFESSEAARSGANQ
jgi:hypothetical protein